LRNEPRMSPTGRRPGGLHSLLGRVGHILGRGIADVSLSLALSRVCVTAVLQEQGDSHQGGQACGQGRGPDQGHPWMKRRSPWPDGLKKNGKKIEFTNKTGPPSFNFLRGKETAALTPSQRPPLRPSRCRCTWKPLHTCFPSSSSRAGGWRCTWRQCIPEGGQGRWPLR